MARLNYDQVRYKDAAEFYARGTPIVERLGLDKSDPIALANALDEYADALNRIGNGVESEVIKQKSLALRQMNPDRKADFVAVRYKCK